MRFWGPKISGYVYQDVDDAEPISDTFGEQAANQFLYNVINPEGGSCALTYDAADLTVDLAAGQITHFGSIVAVAVTANAFTLVADTTFPRWTWLALSSAGAAVVVSGDPATVPSVPELGDRVALALVYVQANLTIANSATYKIDKRLPGYHPAIEELQYTVGDILSTIDPAAAVGTANTAALIPIPPVTAPLTITKLRVNLNASSGNIDAGIYSTVDGAAFTRVVSLGTTTSPGTGIRDLNITDTVLYPGTRYWFAWAADNNTVSPYRYSGNGLNMDSGIARKKATSFPLPATISAATANTLGTTDSPPILYGLVSGGAVA